MKLKIIEGKFYEGEFVKVAINDQIVKRRVYYSTMAGDLYIRYKNNLYFYYEFQ